LEAQRRAYFQTNEALNAAVPSVRWPGGAIVGVSLQQNFSLLVHAAPKVPVVFDINPGVYGGMLPFFGELMSDSPTA